MELSLMTFSMLMDASMKKMDAETLCQVAEQNGLSSLDLMDFDLKVYGKEKLMEAMKRHGIHCGCLIMSTKENQGPSRLSLVHQARWREKSRRGLRLPGNLERTS